MLIKFECISPNGKKITHLGEVFFELPYEPRISRLAYLLYQADNLNFGALISSLMSAPGKIFFIGGQHDERIER